jgi:hypothetical protein
VEQRHPRLQAELAEREVDLGQSLKNSFEMS